MVVTASMEKVYMGQSRAGEVSISCHTLNTNTNTWAELFTTEYTTDKILMLSLSADER